MQMFDMDLDLIIGNFIRKLLIFRCDQYLLANLKNVLQHLMLKFFIIHYKSYMDIHHNQISSKNLQNFRSKSIKNPQHQLMVGLTVKLNAKKFPVDFFSRNDTPTGRIRALYSERIFGSKNEDRKQQRHLQKSNSNQLLPEAQVTSFFNIKYQSTQTSESIPAKINSQQNQTKLSISEFDCMISKQVSTSIQLKQLNQKRQDLCCTFSKIPTSISKLVTPEKKGVTINIKKIDNRIYEDQQFSARSIRPITKRQLRRNTVGKKRKSSIQKINLNNQQSNGNNEITNRKLQKKNMTQFFYLPPIAKRQ